MWKLFDDIYTGIPSGVVITGCVIGDLWTTVRIDGNIGIARTLQAPDNPQEMATQLVGKPLRDIACHLNWDSLTKAAVGVAAMNAWYNTAERAEGLKGIGTEKTVLTGKTAAIGFTPDPNEDADSFAMPMSPDFDRSEYETLKDYDNVIISGKSLITRSLPALLDIIGEGSNVIMRGHSVPCSAAFFAFNMPIREVRGYYTSCGETIEACAVDNIEDPAPGLLPYCIRPIKVE